MSLRQPPSIDAYGARGFRISGERWEGSILVLDDQARHWPVARLADLAPGDFAGIVAAGPQTVELVLLGTGVQTAIAPRAVRAAMLAAGLGLEVMNTPEACRLYNVLALEGRRIAAALIAV